MSLFLKYYGDVNQYNLLISFLLLMISRDPAVSILSFCSFGLVISFVIYRYYYNIQYYFYANAGVSKAGLMTRTAVINVVLSSLILLLIK